MRPVNPKKSKVFSFLIGLIYGYRTAHMDLKRLPLSQYDPSNHEGYDIYFLDKKTDRVSKNEPIDEPTHIVAIKEDIENKQVKVYIYKS